MAMLTVVRFDTSYITLNIDVIFLDSVILIVHGLPYRYGIQCNIFDTYIVLIILLNLIVERTHSAIIRSYIFCLLRLLTTTQCTPRYLPDVKVYNYHIAPFKEKRHS